MTSWGKAKRPWDGMVLKYPSIEGRIPTELHALGSDLRRDAGEDTDIYVNL